MNRGIALVVAVVAVVGLVSVAAAAPVGTVVAQDDPVTNGTDTNDTSEAGENDTSENDTSAESGGADVSPGERFSGVVGVQQAEIAGEVSSRSFEVALDRADTDAERAAVVAERLNRTEDQLGAIERRQRELRERRDAGELSQGAFAARMAEIGARAESARREVNRSAAVADRLPESARAQRGLDEERVNAVRQQASDLSGPEVAALARGIAGNETGRPLAADRRGPPARGGPLNDVPNGTDPDRGQPETPGRPGVDRPAAAPDAPNQSGGAAGRGNGTDVQIRPDTRNASTTDPSNRSPGTAGAAGRSGNGSTRGDGPANDSSAGGGESGDGDGASGVSATDRGGDDGGDGSAGRGSGGDGSAGAEAGGDGSAGDGSAEAGAGGDGSTGRGSGAEAGSDRDRPSIGPLGSAGAFLRNAWNTVAVIGPA